MKSLDFLKEDIVTDAQDMQLDHEVQMARKDCYTAAENAIALHRLLRNVSEQQGLEGWVAAKITLASDYLDTVREYLEYNLLSMGDAPAEVVMQPAEMPIAEARVGNRMSDMSVGSPKVVHQNGRAVGEIGIDHEASPGNGPYYMKHYETNTWHSGYATKKEALADLKHVLSQMNENAGSVATVVNPPAKDKAKVGSLFGGTYKQKKAK